jgi:hypothetical protein
MSKSFSQKVLKFYHNTFFHEKIIFRALWSQPSEKRPFSKKYFQFPKMDIFKNVQNRFPFLLFEKKLLLENAIKNTIKLLHDISSYILLY